MIWGTVKGISDNNDLPIGVDSIVRRGQHVYFYTEVNEATVLTLQHVLDDTVKHIRYMELDGFQPINNTIYLHINSPGGYVSDCFAACDAIQRSKIPVTGVGQGLVASAATLILASCHHRTATPNAQFLYHPMSAGYSGTYEDFQDFVKSLDDWQRKIINILAARSKMKPEHVANMLQRETYMDVREALSRDLIDELYT